MWRSLGTLTRIYKKLHTIHKIKDPVILEEILSKVKDLSIRVNVFLHEVSPPRYT